MRNSKKIGAWVKMIWLRGVSTFVAKHLKTSNKSLAGVMALLRRPRIDDDCLQSQVNHAHATKYYRATLITILARQNQNIGPYVEIVNIINLLIVDRFHSR